MKRFSTLLLFSMVLSVGLSAKSPKQDSLRIFFIGNSYTFYHQLPQRVSELAAAANRPVAVGSRTVGGKTFEWHWLNGTQEKMRERKWDYVVLQEHSLGTIRNPKNFFDYGQRWVEAVRSHGAQPLFYMTWARAHKPLMSDTIRPAYEQIAAENNVL